MKRQELADGYLPAWAAEELQTDKNELPMSWSIADGREGKEHGARISVSIDGKNVALSCELESGCREIEAMVGLDTYMGVTMALAIANDENGEPDRPAMMVLLEHSNPDLTVPLYVAWESDNVVEEWQSWARALGLPARVRGLDKTSHQPLGMVCGVDFTPSSKRAVGYRASKTHNQRTRSARRANAVIAAGHGRMESRELMARH